METALWPSPPPLEADQVHIWWATSGAEEPLPRLSSAGETLTGWLSEEERGRAARFHFERHRRRFRLRRGFLRGLLAAYLNADPAALTFQEGERGKPALAKQFESRLSFNLSHSQGWVLLAITLGRELGVDVECERLRTGLEPMARQVFTAGERSQLEGADEDQRLDLFFRGWTRKEAALKATGEGFGREPRTLHVGLEDHRPLEPWRAEGEPVLRNHVLMDLAAPAGFQAAICVLGEGWQPRVVTDPGAPVRLDS